MEYKLIKNRDDAAELTDLMIMEFEYRYNVMRRNECMHEDGDSIQKRVASDFGTRIIELVMNMYVLGYEFQTQKKR